MSQTYEFHITVEGFDPAKKNEIQAEVESSWDFADWYEFQSKNGPAMRSSGTDQLAGQSDTEFAGELTAAIWKINGKFCKVTVNSTFLDNLPTDTYSFEEEEYKDFLDEQKKNNSEEAEPA